MEKQINEISLNIALNLLNDYIKEKSLQLTHIHQRFAREFVSKHEVDLHQWLLTETKTINQTVKNLFEGTKDYFADIKFEFVYDFFDKCCTLLEQNCKYLSQAVMEKINKKIDVMRSHIFVAPAPPVILGTSEKQSEEPKDERLKRYSKQINRDLESLDYFLNLLAYEDNKTYEEYKSQCDKLLLQRQLLQNIKPSEASKEIMETANMIDNVMENSDKVFQDSYILKYMEFKSFLNDLKKPEELTELYRQDMEHATKEKFKEGINRTLKKCYAINKRENMKNKISFATQTEEIKVLKYQQKLQNLLLIQKKNNQKLAAEIKSLRKNKSNLEDQQQLQKVIDEGILKQKEADNKYRILENMYNQKCEEVLKMPQQKIYLEKEREKKTMIAIGLQAQPQNRSILIQTDLDFYYYFESNKIYDYKVRIVELEQQIKHKEYIIKQMEAIRTFRDNFKSKKQVYSTAIRSTKNIERAKSLHYLNEDDEIFDIRNEDKAQLSLEGLNTKKKVTLQDLDQSGEARNLAIANSKKSKKKTEIFKNKPYFALNSKVQDEIEEEQNKSECELQKISIKSILKLGLNQFKKEVGIQADLDKNGIASDYVVQQSVGKSKIEKVKLSSRDRSERSVKLSKTKMRSSQVSSQFKETKQKSNLFEQVALLKRSNFVALGELNDRKQQKQTNITLNSPTIRLSGINPVVVSPKKLLQPKSQKMNYLLKASKLNESKVNTVGNEVLHVNNSLNCNFLAPITNNLKQSVSSSSFFKNKSKYENMKKTKPSKMI